MTFGDLDQPFLAFLFVRYLCVITEKYCHPPNAICAVTVRLSPMIDGFCLH